MNKKRLKATQAFTDSETIAALKSAVEDLASGRKKSNELEGIIAEARALAQGWKIKEPGGHRRPLLENFSNDKTFLLAALVVALRPYYERLEPILRLAPNEFEEASFVTRQLVLRQVAAAVATHSIAGLPKSTAKQKYELKRRLSFANRFRSIEYEFGSADEAGWRKQEAAFYTLPALDLGTPAGHQTLRTPASEPTCLDEIFAGQTVNMKRLEELFGSNRHRLSQVVHASRKPPYNYLEVVKIMDALLSEKPRKMRKKSRAGRPSRPPWLNDADLRTRVLSGIQARIEEIGYLLRSIQGREADLWKLTDRDLGFAEAVFKHFRGYAEWEKEIADRFLSIVHRHLPESGKK